MTTGFERYRLPYNALTQTSLNAVDVSTKFLGAPLRAPVLIGAMTGGAELSGTINRNLAEAAQKLGIGMMLGSQRIMLDNSVGRDQLQVRELAPDVLLIGNIGLAQLSEAIVPDLVAALDRSVPTRWRCTPTRSRRRCRTTATPTSPARWRGCANWPTSPLPGAGQGSRPRHRRRCRRATRGMPIAAVDVAGAGGTSWARVEQLVRYGEVRDPAIAEWGIPTAQALAEVQRRCRACRWWPLVAFAPGWTPPRR